MALQVKVPCPCTYDTHYQSIKPEVIKQPWRCVWCNGAKEVERTVTFDTYSGKFGGIDWDAIGEFGEDIYVSFNCQCGDTISFSEAGYMACSCGRVYRLSTSLKVDETHLGDTGYLINKHKKSER